VQHRFALGTLANKAANKTARLGFCRALLQQQRFALWSLAHKAALLGLTAPDGI
jgi:hypothetical protein